MIGLDSPVAALGITARRRTDILQEMGVATVRDLLLRFPTRHEAFDSSAEIGSLEPGKQVMVAARIVKCANRRAWKRRMTMTEAVLDDGTGTVKAIWFNQPYLIRTLAAGKAFRFTGKVTQGKFGLQLTNPMYERIDYGAVAGAVAAQEVATGAATVVPFSNAALEREPEGSDSSFVPERSRAEPPSAPALLPVYPLTVGMSQHAFRKIVASALPVAEQIEDPLPDALRRDRGLSPLAVAIRAIHAPADEQELRAARHRLAFDEALRLQLALGRLRRLREKRSAPIVPFDEVLTKAFTASLPFHLTDGQRLAAMHAIKDMGTGHQMHRLLDGDVGSGKTLVAAIAMLNVARAGFQCAFMAPTEILAAQHFATLTRLFKDQPFQVALWTNSYKKSARGGQETVAGNKRESGQIGDEIAAGGTAIVVGTHALVEEKMRFASLALAVVDEQHRFGVRIRHLLTEKSGLPGLEPHLLSMTATPIPRSLALAVFGDLELSVLREKPVGRQSIITRLVAPADRSTAYARIREEIAAGRQAFVVCPLIDPSDTLGVASVTEEYDRLRNAEFKGLTIGILHGKMKSTEKEKAMTDFLAGKTQVLVSTSVVEVGVDVPNATVMCIDGAERFGLAQLHQFRGRVGRGAHRSYCYLMPTSLTAGVKSRLQAVVEHEDGFTLAEKDLEMRGPGDVLGTAQSGFPEFKLASFSDARLIADAKEAAEAILKEDPDLKRHVGLRAGLKAAAEEAHLE